MAPLGASGFRVSGTVRVPGDKSISHRALMLSALGDGRSRITGILRSADVQSTAGVLRALGADVPELTDDFVVQGRGTRSLREPNVALDCGNSGTTARLMAGIVAGNPLQATFVGDESLSRRPMGRVARPLAAMGAGVTLSAGERLPMTVLGGELHSLEWESETASAQVKSALLLAGMTAGVEVTVREPHLSRDHTERMLAARGAEVWVNANAVMLWPVASLPALDVQVPGDPSSAAFFAGLAAIASGGEIAMPDVCLNVTRIGALAVLARMGLDIETTDERLQGGEQVGSLVVRPAALVGTTIEPAEVPSLIDELPMIACVAALADGETTVSGAGELRVKESDRIAAVVDNLRTLGADAEERPDGFVVRGGRRPLRGRVTTHGDHRLAMAFGMLGAVPGNEIEVDDRECVRVSYPGFWETLARVTAGG